MTVFCWLVLSKWSDSNSIHDNNNCIHASIFLKCEFGFNVHSDWQTFGWIVGTEFQSSYSFVFDAKNINSMNLIIVFILICIIMVEHPFQRLASKHPDVGKTGVRLRQQNVDAKNRKIALPLLPSAVVLDQCPLSRPLSAFSTNGLIDGARWHSPLQLAGQVMFGQQGRPLGGDGAWGEFLHINIAQISKPARVFTWISWSYINPIWNLRMLMS